MNIDLDQVIDAKAGSIKATHKLFLQLRPVLEAIAVKITKKNSHVEREDALQELYEIYLKALKAFDETKEYKFTTYLTAVVKDRIKYYCNCERYSLRVPDNLWQSVYHYNKTGELNTKTAKTTNVVKQLRTYGIDSLSTIVSNEDEKEQILQDTIEGNVPSPEQIYLAFESEAV